MSTLITPNFKLTKSPKFNFWVMEDTLNNGQKYIMTKHVLKEHLKHISLALGIFK